MRGDHACLAPSNTISTAPDPIRQQPHVTRPAIINLRQPSLAKGITVRLVVRLSSYIPVLTGIPLTTSNTMGLSQRIRIIMVRPSMRLEFHGTEPNLDLVHAAKPVAVERSNARVLINPNRRPRADHEQHHFLLPNFSPIFSGECAAQSMRCRFSNILFSAVLVGCIDSGWLSSGVPGRHIELCIIEPPLLVHRLNHRCRTLGSNAPEQLHLLAVLLDAPLAAVVLLAVV